MKFLIPTILASCMVSANVLPSAETSTVSTADVQPAEVVAKSADSNNSTSTFSSSPIPAGAVASEVSSSIPGASSESSAPVSDTSADSSSAAPVSSVPVVSSESVAPQAPSSATSVSSESAVSSESVSSQAPSSGPFCSANTEGQKLAFKQSGKISPTVKTRVGECPLTSEPVCYHGYTKEHMENERFPLCWYKVENYYNCNHQEDGECRPDAIDISKVCPHDIANSSTKMFEDLFVYDYVMYPGFTVDPKVVKVHQADQCVKINSAYLERN